MKKWKERIGLRNQNKKTRNQDRKKTRNHTKRKKKNQKDFFNR